MFSYYVLPRLGCCLASDPLQGILFSSRFKIVWEGYPPLLWFRVPYMLCKCQRSIHLNTFKTNSVLFDVLKNIIKIFFEKAL